MEHSASFLMDGVLLLGFGLGFVLLFRKLGLGATLGYLVAGAVVGPHVLNLAGDAEAMIPVAELGITLLLFIVGLELSPSRLWAMKSEIFGLGLLQVVLCGLALSALLYFATPFTIGAALAIGLPLALSSTAQVLPMLQSAGRLHTPFGERAFSILLFQDLSIIPLLTIVAALSRNPAQDTGPPGWQMVIQTLLAVAGLVLAGRFLVRPLFRLISRLGEREMFIVAALAVVVAAAALMEALGLSTALGAFIAGVMLADTPFRHEIEADVEPFRSILLGLFFLAVGMMLDLSVIAANPLFVVGTALALIATKTVVIGALGLAFGMRWQGALALGLLLSQGGEFGFVLFTRAQQGLLIEPEAASLFGAIVTLSMATTPFLMMLTKRIRREVPVAEVRDGPRRDGASALVVGYGRFGQTVAQMLILSDIPVTLIDTDTEMIDVAGTFGAKVYFGDGTRIDLLRQAGAGEASMILFCLDGDNPTADLLQSVREHFPQAKIYARVFDRRSLIDLRDAPLDYAIREVMESAVQMARAALEELGDSLQDVDKAEAAYRANDSERLDLQKGEGNYRAGIDRMITQEARAARGKPVEE
ncbi:sodium:proton exchanger [Altererythrobacter salegens]|uniref:Sodium:proton exchanger n=1 Tax=Croceibacterium salegens TaxID=1737568 RepID=A0A6I4SYM5_9SPHN|nr:cation:proton antiporter [Croceibacterium salegens]MXO61155.1 sodium:proton exchanger [Croceibacterium salegens]